MGKGIALAKGSKSRQDFHSTGRQLALTREQAIAILIPLLVDLRGLSGAGVAQLVEHLICNQGVGGSIPSASSTGTC